MAVHILAAAAFRDELAPLAADTHARLACLAHGHAEGKSLPDNALQQASDTFRRVRGLQSAEATSAWMTTRAVTIEAFTDYLEREAYRATWGDGALPAGDGTDPAHPDLVRSLWPDAVFSGVADRWIQELAARVAVLREEQDGTAIPPSLFDGAGVARPVPDAFPAWLRRLGLAPGWQETIVALEAAYRRFALNAHAHDRLDEALRRRWNVLFAFDIEMCGFPSEAAAREACLCISEDGADMKDVGDMAGGTYQQSHALLGDFPEAIRARALSAPENALLPIFPWGEQFIVCRVCSKSEPSLTDAKTRAVVEDLVLHEAVAPLLARHITWPEGRTR